MPLPPADAVEAAESGTDPEFEFTKVECLLLAFHTVGKQAPEHLTENPEVLKDFRVNENPLSFHVLEKKGSAIFFQVPIFHSLYSRHDFNISPAAFKATSRSLKSSWPTKLVPSSRRKRTRSSPWPSSVPWTSNHWSRISSTHRHRTKPRS